MERRCPYLYTGSKYRVIGPSVLIIQGALGKYVWEKPSRVKPRQRSLAPLTYTMKTLQKKKQNKTKQNKTKQPSLNFFSQKVYHQRVHIFTSNITNSPFVLYTFSIVIGLFHLNFTRPLWKIQETPCSAGV